MEMGEISTLLESDGKLGNPTAPFGLVLFKGLLAVRYAGMTPAELRREANLALLLFSVPWWTRCWAQQEIMASTKSREGTC